ncbi:hypothetical protein KC345_g238 [Hortaea werneckii]|nr:hypothetical protein KC345_g238 [Hortaea werneckii]
MSGPISLLLLLLLLLLPIMLVSGFSSPMGKGGRGDSPLCHAMHNIPFHPIPAAASAIADHVIQTRARNFFPFFFIFFIFCIPSSVSFPLTLISQIPIPSSSSSSSIMLSAHSNAAESKTPDSTAYC